MSEEQEQVPSHHVVDDDLIADTLSGLIARDKNMRRFECMTLPAPLLNDLVRRILDPGQTTAATADWLTGECAVRNIDSPGRSSVFRFARVAREEFDLAKLDRTMKLSSAVTQALSNGEDKPDKITNGLQHLLTRLMVEANSDGKLDLDSVSVLVKGVRAVALNNLGREALDVRNKALEAQIAQRNATILVLNQRLEQIPEKIKAIEAKLEQAQKAQVAGKKVDASIYASIRQELTRVRDVATPAAPIGTEGGIA